MIPFLALASFLAATQDAPVELGRISWKRDHDAAFAEARAAHKPVLLFFQEVPG